MKSDKLMPKRAIFHLLNPSQRTHSISMELGELSAQQTTEEINIDEAKARVDRVKAKTLQISWHLTLA